MPILCEHVHRLELRKSFKLWVAVATWQVYRKARLSVIPVFYFGPVCLKLNIVLISILTGKMLNTKFKKTYAILVYGHVDILWIYHGTKIQMMILA